MKTMTTSTTRRSAFSMMELLVVISIVAVLMAILMPTFQAIKARAEGIKCMNNLRNIHTGFMLFFADNGFFPLGLADWGAAPTQKWSRVKQNPVGGYTNWQIEIAAYLGDGRVAAADWNLTGGEEKLLDARTQTNAGVGYRLPLAFRCPTYNRILKDRKYQWTQGSVTVYMDHFGYCYNQWLMTNNRSEGDLGVNYGPYMHQGRDPRKMASDYAPPNTSVNSAYLFCSRWGSWYVKKAAQNCDVSGTKYAGIATRPWFEEWTGATYRTGPRGEGNFGGVAIGIHSGKDNFMFLDGHMELLDPKDVADRLRMNKSWWRPLPADGSFGNYGDPVGRGWCAMWYDSTDGYGAGTRRKDGVWDTSTPPADYNWDI